MNRYILFGLTSLMAFSLNASAQEEATGEGTVSNAPRVATSKSQYPTRQV